MPLFSRNVRNVYGWLTWITSSLLPFNFCENEMARRYSNLGPIRNKTLMKWMHQMCRWLEAKLKKTLPESFACVFDAWTCGSTHYVAVFASFPSDSLRGYEKVLLALSPINDEDSLSAAAFLEFFDFVLDVYGKQVALIGDNCASNRVFTRLAGIPMVGCASHRFNLFVGDVLADYEELLCAVHAIMKKLSNVIPAAKLRRMTPLCPKQRNKTRWSSTVAMLAQYVELKPFLPQLGLDDIDMLLNNSWQDRDVELLIAQLTDLNSVTLALQDKSLTLADVRLLFDDVVVQYPGAEVCLGSDASIVEDPTFESGVVKVLQHMEASLNEDERMAIALLSMPSMPNGGYVGDTDSMSMATRALKRRKLLQARSNYLDCRFLRPTSNMCERLFSVTKWAMTDRRRSVLPANFEE
ncbi:hypothetical protein DYB30_011046 [Aphanomyces astaci]|uniref:DUF659 domain-containing protein n=1 Tax=Aphanomyces astaci TaxID=112090 RepID=A0A397CVB0_APHAT|nr:hypothetical protein DYB30_011046 [Aphanomyces astaci]